MKTQGKAELTLPARKLLDICRALPEDAAIRIAMEVLAAGVFAHTGTPGLSRMTVVVDATADAAARIEANLYKLVHVQRVENVTADVLPESFRFLRQDADVLLPEGVPRARDQSARGRLQVTVRPGGSP
mgnify:CR=1 FL=1